MAVSATYFSGEVSVRYEADTGDELVSLLRAMNKQCDDGWIEWEGGECPIDPALPVEVRTSRGTKCVGYAGHFSWVYGGIKGYRILS